MPAVPADASVARRLSTVRCCCRPRARPIPKSRRASASAAISRRRATRRAADVAGLDSLDGGPVMPQPSLIRANYRPDAAPRTPPTPRRRPGRRRLAVALAWKRSILVECIGRVPPFTEPCARYSMILVILSTPEFGRVTCRGARAPVVRLGSEPGRLYEEHHDDEDHMTRGRDALA